MTQPQPQPQTQPQTQPSTLQIDDEATDALARMGEVLDEVKETLKRIARAVEGLSAAGSG